METSTVLVAGVTGLVVERIDASFSKLIILNYSKNNTMGGIRKSFKRVGNFKHQ